MEEMEKMAVVQARLSTVLADSAQDVEGCVRTAADLTEFLDSTNPDAVPKPFAVVRSDGAWLMNIPEQCVFVAEPPVVAPAGLEEGGEGDDEGAAAPQVTGGWNVGPRTYAAARWLNLPLRSAPGWYSVDAGTWYCRVGKGEGGYTVELTDREPSDDTQGFFSWFRVVDIPSPATEGGNGVVQYTLGAVFLDDAGEATHPIPFSMVMDAGRVRWLCCPENSVVCNGESIPVVGTVGGLLPVGEGDTWGWCEYDDDLSRRFVVATGEVKYDGTMTVPPNYFLNRFKICTVRRTGDAVAYRKGTLVVDANDFQPPKPFQLLTHTTFMDGTPDVRFRIYTPPYNCVLPVTWEKDGDGNYSYSIGRRTFSFDTLFFDVAPGETYFCWGEKGSDVARIAVVDDEDSHSDALFRFPVCGPVLRYKFAAVLVFVNEAQDGLVRQGAQGDRDFWEGLVRPHADNLVVLWGEDATKAKVVDALKEVVEVSDTTMFFVCCHGGEGRNQYMWLYDGAFTDEELWNIISLSKGRVWCVFECCYSGSMYGGPDVHFPDDESLAAVRGGAILTQRRVDELAASRGAEEGFSLLSWAAAPEDAVGWAADDMSEMTRIIKDAVEAQGSEATYKSVWRTVADYYANNPSINPTRAIKGAGFKGKKLFQ